VRSAQVLESMVEERTRALREAQARLRALIDNEPECVKLLDAEGRLLEMNAAGLRMIEVERAEAVLGQCVYGIVAPEHVDAFRSLTERVCRGERGTLEFEMVGLKGTRRWLETHAVPFHDEASGETRLLSITRDVTGRKHAEQALRESERRFHAFMEHLPAAAWIKDARLRYIYVNRAYERVYGWRAKDVLGREDFELHAPELARFFRDDDEKILRAGVAAQRLHDVPYADGRPGHWLVAKFPLDDAAGETGVAGIAVDVTERKQAEEALQALLEGTASVTGERFFPALVRSVARATKVRYAFVTELLDGARLRMLAIWAGDGPAKPVEYDLVHTPCRIVIEQGEACFADSVQQAFPRDQDLVDLGAASYLGIAMRDAAGKTLGHLCILDDKPLRDEARIASLLRIFVSRAAAELERKQAEDALRASQAEIRGLLDRLVSMQESERRRVADELHDLIGQNLTALGIDLQALKQRLQAAGDRIAGPRLDAMAGLLETTIDSIRGVITDLRPVALQEFGLLAALRWYASQFSERTGMNVSTQCEGREARLAPDTELALFRIAQEALTNAAKHSGGSGVEISIRYGEPLILIVKDDGRGFAQASGAPRGFGLPSMRERAEAQGGSLRVETAARGTQVVVEIPVLQHGD